MTSDPEQKNVKPGELRSPDTTAIHEHDCLLCGKHVDSVSNAEGGARKAPNPGDPVACIRCGAVMTYERGRLRPFTDAEAKDPMRDEACMRTLRRVVGAIHLVRAGQN